MGFTKKMNEISASKTANISERRVSTPNSSQNLGHKMKETKTIKRLDSEFGINETEEDKMVIVSPKSSMISSRLAEPETADVWANQMIHFSEKFKRLITIAIDKNNMVVGAVKKLNKAKSVDVRHEIMPLNSGRKAN